MIDPMDEPRFEPTFWSFFADTLGVLAIVAIFLSIWVF